MKIFNPEIHKGTYIKATDEIKKALNLTPEKLLQMIDDNKIDGYVDGRTIMLNETAVPEDFRPRNPNAPPKPPSEREMTLAEVEKIKAETAKIRAQIDYELIKGERDKPEILRQQEEELKTWADELDAREQSMTDKETDLLQRVKTITEKEGQIQTTMIEMAQINQKKIDETKALCDKMLAEIQQHVKSKQAELDVSEIQRQEALSKIEQDIARKTQEKLALEKTIAEYQQQVAPFRQELADLTMTARRKAENAHYQGQKSNSTYHYQKAKHFWGIEEQLKKLAKSLGLA